MTTMAQTKRKRRTKHRGNAAGTIEARGRTGRPPSATEKKQVSREQAREKRLNTPPTWTGSAKRALLAGGFMFIFLYLTDHPQHGSRILSAVIFALVAMALYIPGGYYMEMYLYRRRMAKKAASTKR
jgi:Flp pilus assembly protein TadB